MALFQRTKTPFAEFASEGAAPSLGPRSAGEALRERREALGLGLGEVAEALRIKPAYLSALEAGNPDELPGPVYAVGFVRAYSDHLGLDSGEILRRFRLESTGLSARPDLSFPIPLGERSVPGGGMLLVALILAICGYGTWYYLSTAERSRPERVADLPAALAQSNLIPPPGGPTTQISPTASTPPAPSDATKTKPSTATETAAQQLGPAPAPAPAPAASSAEPAPAAAAWTLPALAAASPSPAASPAPTVSPNANPPTAPQGPTETSADSGRVYGDTTGPVRIVMRAVADSWVQVRDADRSTLFTRLLKAGDTYRVPERPGASMLIGNAGGLEIMVDGKAAPPVGPMGAVRRDVALDPEALMAGTAVRQ
jgi:cytoskeleton protein RodZ